MSRKTNNSASGPNATYLRALAQSLAEQDSAVTLGEVIECDGDCGDECRREHSERMREGEEVECRVRQQSAEKKDGEKGDISRALKRKRESEEEGVPAPRFCLYTPMRISSGDIGADSRGGCQQLVAPATRTTQQSSPTRGDVNEVLIGFPCLNLFAAAGKSNPSADPLADSVYERAHRRRADFDRREHDLLYRDDAKDILGFEEMLKKLYFTIRTAHTHPEMVRSCGVDWYERFERRLWAFRHPDADRFLGLEALRARPSTGMRGGPRTTLVVREAQVAVEDEKDEEDEEDGYELDEIVESDDSDDEDYEE